MTVPSGGSRDWDLSGRTAIVTGASRGIGLACAQALHDAGASVVLTSRYQEAAEEAAAAVGERALGVAAHAADPDAAAACVEQAIARFGSLDVLVNNAGINPYFGPLMEIESGQLRKTLEVNLEAPLLWTQLAWRASMRENGGAVINVASVGGLVTSLNLGSYNASKAGLIHLGRHLALELGPAVRVNTLAPGLVKTKFSQALWRDGNGVAAERLAMKRLGVPEDTAHAVRFLASDAASWVTGSTLVVDGGEQLGELPA